MEAPNDRVRCSNCQHTKPLDKFSHKPDGSIYKTCESCRVKLSKTPKNWNYKKYDCECGKTITNRNKKRHLEYSCPRVKKSQ